MFTREFISTQQRTADAIENFSCFVESVPLQVTIINLISSGIKHSTASGYLSKLRTLARFINALTNDQQQRLGVVPIPVSLIDGGASTAINLEVAVARSTTLDFFTQFLGLRAGRGLTSNSAIRCALQKAQKLAGCPEWANGAICKERTALAERQAERNHPGTLPVGAITEEMLDDMIGITNHPHIDMLSLFWQAEYYGCFRFNEIFNITAKQVRETGVELLEEYNKLDKPTHPKGPNHNTTRRKTTDVDTVDPSVAKTIYFKHLAGWPSGKRALEILRQLSLGKREDDRLFPHGMFTYKSVAKIKEAQVRLQWPDTMKFGSHGLRHGGVHQATVELGGVVSEEEAEALLIMSGDMVDHYKRTNAERLSHAAHVRDSF